MSPGENPLVFRRAPSGFSRRKVRQHALRLRETVTEGRPFCCLLTNDQELARLNLQFLGRNYPTDVLSFPVEGAGQPLESLGDLAISVERAAEQALRHGHGVEDEIAILMLHGALHLLGMDHETDGGRMRRAETAWRRKLGLPSGLIERVRR